MEDPDVLALAASLGRVLVSHDHETMPGHFYRFLEKRESPGLILVPQVLAIGSAIEELTWLGQPDALPGYNRTMTGAVEIGSPVDRDPAIRAGRPKIAGTGVIVMRVAAWYKMGLSPEQIATQHGHLSLAQVHAALAYYHANPEEIEADLSEEEAFAVGASRKKGERRRAFKF